MSFIDAARNLLHKISGALPIVIMQFRNQKSGVYTKRNFAQYSDDAYKRNVIAYKAINCVSKAVANVPLRVKLGEERYAETGHPLVDLLYRPNPWMSGKMLIENLIAYYLLTGNSYLEGVSDNSGSGFPRELYVHRPDRMRVVIGTIGIEQYVYDVNGQKKYWDCDPIDGTSPILHIKTFNPLDDWYGMSPVEAAAYAIDQHNMAGEWNQALLQNSARPSGAMVYKSENGAVLTDKQVERIKQDLNAAYAGGRNSGRPMLLEGGLSWQQMSMTPAEMDWINGKNVSAREIALAFGVAPQILGIPGDNTYSNYQEARLSLYEDTVIPMLESVLDCMNHWLAPMLGNGVAIVPCYDDVPALAPKREKRWDMVAGADWLTINEKRKATGFEPLEDEEADELFIASGLIPLAGSTEPPETDETLPGGAAGEAGVEKEEEDEKPKSYLQELLEKAWQDQPRDELGRFSASDAVGARTLLTYARQLHPPSASPTLHEAVAAAAVTAPQDLGRQSASSMKDGNVYDYNEHSERVVNSASAAEKAAVRRFSGQDYMDLRMLDADPETGVKIMSEGLDMTDEQIRDAQSTVANLNSLIDRESITYPTLYRGLSVNDATLDAMKSGRSIEFDAMSSASISFETADEFTKMGHLSNGVILAMEGGSGIGIERMSKSPIEKEVLMGKGQKFRVHSVSTVNEVTVLHMKRVESKSSGGEQRSTAAHVIKYGKRMEACVIKPGRIHLS